MKRWFTFITLALVCVSCAPKYKGVPGQPPFAAELEPYEEAVDRGCSYFNFLWGKNAELEERFDEALYAYKQALLCDRRADHIMRSLAMLLIKTGQKQEAAKWINKIIELKPDDASAKNLLAGLYSSLNMMDKAAEIYEGVLAKDPKNFNTMLLLGGLYARHRQYDKAKEVLERLVNENEDSYAGYYYLANLYREMRIFDKATKAYEKALALNWSSLLAFEVGELYEELKRYSAAEKIYLRVLEEDMSSERARSYLADVYLQLKEVDKAIAQLNELKNISSDRVKIDLTIARILVENERYGEAITLLDKMLEEDPESPRARSLLILAYYQKGDMAQTKKVLHGVQPGSQAYEESTLMLARLLQDEEDFAGAETVLSEALATEDRRLIFSVALAMLYYRQELVEKGLAVFDSAFTLFDDKTEVRYELALYLHKIGEPERAMAEMERVIKENPQHGHALNYVGYTWAEEGKNLQQAKEYIEQAVTLLPKDGFVRDSLGWVYYQLGDFTRAIKELQRAVELSSAGDPAIWEHLGDAYLKADQPEEARGAYERSLKLFDKEEDKEKIRGKIRALGVKSKVPAQ